MRAFGFISRWHGNEPISIEIGSLLFIFAGSRPTHEPLFDFQGREKKNNKCRDLVASTDRCDNVRTGRVSVCAVTPWHSSALTRATTAVVVAVLSISWALRSLPPVPSSGMGAVKIPARIHSVYMRADRMRRWVLRGNGSL